jgi:hypothetical protein
MLVSYYADGNGDVVERYKPSPSINLLSSNIFIIALETEERDVSVAVVVDHFTMLCRNDNLWT